MLQVKKLNSDSNKEQKRYNTDNQIKIKLSPRLKKLLQGKSMG